MVKDLIVLGGGNAGLMTALYLKESIPDLNLTVIKSSKIGTIGVGEGSTEHWKMFASATRISIADMIRECGATFKIGIKFENWHGDGTSYYHSLPEALVDADSYTGIPYAMLKLIADGIGTENLHWQLPMDGYIREPLDQYYQFHFDSEKLNTYLLKKCDERDIKVVDAEINNCVLDNEGFISSIVDDNGLSYSADFFIDSSGFKRVLASRLGAEWVDWSEYLPTNSALAFQTPYEENIPPYTLSRSMNAGWMWRAPVQDRFGNGYVYDDRFISEEDALKEVQQYFDFPLNIGRRIKYTSGKVNKAWIKNCVCIGLSSNFVEPLEASSISTTIQQSRLLASSLWNWNRSDQGTINKYNEIVDDMMFNILDFIQLHYYTQRQDTKFWKWCKNEMKITDFNKENLSNFKNNFISQTLLPEDGTFGTYRIYDCLNWIQVMHGLRMFNIENIKKIYNSHTHLKNIELKFLQLPSQPDETWITCRDAVNLVKNSVTEIKL